MVAETQPKDYSHTRGYVHARVKEAWAGLQCGFIWSSTPEGPEYWLDVCRRLERIMEANPQTIMDVPLPSEEEKDEFDDPWWKTGEDGA